MSEDHKSDPPSADAPHRLAVLRAPAEPGLAARDEALAATTPDFRLTAPDTTEVPQVDAGLAPPARSSNPRLPTGIHDSGKLGRFNILDTLGSGGMGIVLAAYDPQLDRKVAIKVLRTRGLTGPRREKEAARLLREARSMAQLSHPHVVTVYEAGTIDERVFIAMEYVPGQTLRAWLADHKRSVAEIVDVYVKAGRGLAAGHHAGLIHRDFKPDNVLVGFDGRVRVIDFGLARPTRGMEASMAELDRVDPADSDSLKPGMNLTTVGSLFGTPMYMAPEQHRKEELDARADQFAFCVSLFEALYGRVPFPAQSYGELAVLVTEGKVVEPEANPAIPGRIVAAVLRGLRSDPDARFASMDELLDELQPPARRRRGLVLLSTGIGAVVAAAITLAVVRMTAGTPVADPCQGGEERFAGVWDAQVKDAVRTAFLATGRTHAPETLAHVFDQLDRYKTRWVDRRREVCRATELNEQSQSAMELRMQCLRERLDVVRSLAALFVRADVATVDNAVGAATDVSSPDSCMKLTPGAAPPDPLRAAQLEPLDRTLADVRAYLALNKFVLAEQTVVPVIRAAEKIGEVPFVIETRLSLITALMGMSKFGEAEHAIRETLVIAARAKSDKAIAQLWVDLVWALGQQPPRQHDAIALRPVVELAIVRADAPEVRSELAYNLAATYFNMGEYKLSSERFEEARDLRSAALGERDVNIGRLYTSLGGAYLRSGNLFAAKEAFEKALDITERAKGPSHPDVALPLSNLGSLAQAMGDFDRATAIHTRALKIFEEINGPDHEQVGLIVYSLGVSANGREDYKGAIPYYERALKIFEKISPDHAYVGLSLVGLADCREEVGDYPQAVVDGERGHQRVASSNGDPVQLALAQYVLAKALWSANRDRPRARALATEARKGFAAGGLAALNGLAAVDAWFKKIDGK